MSFLTSISFQDLSRLREVVRRVHMTHYPDRHLNHIEMDRLIEALGPEILEAEIRSLVDGEVLIPSDMRDKVEGEVR